ncbi:MAG: hypothetical protein COB14_04675 [Alphaproteobacteria bacterium]|nr:MAG: hypothetical protein COB14_04675 [Alphaproteobacteria bacterium]
MTTKLNAKHFNEKSEGALLGYSYSENRATQEYENVLITTVNNNELSATYELDIVKSCANQFKGVFVKTVHTEAADVGTTSDNTPEHAYLCTQQFLIPSKNADNFRETAFRGLDESRNQHQFRPETVETILTR